MAQNRVARSLRYAGYLAILFGAAGALSGVIGAGTFIPYRGLDSLSLSLAQELTAISAVGAAVSIAGIVAGWGLLRDRAWSWGLSMGVVVGALASVGAMAAVWPPSSPFLGVAAFFYAIEVILLLAGFGPVRASAARRAVAP